MFSLDEFISRSVTRRPIDWVGRQDMDRLRPLLSERIRDRRVLVIGGAGSIGSAFIRELVTFRPAEVVVMDISENSLAELTRSLRADGRVEMPTVWRTYALNFADPIARDIIAEGPEPFHIVANFSAHKHVRSEKDRHSVHALLKNNVLHAQGLMELLSERRPERFFCVSTDKAAAPANVMGASKRLMEDLVMAYAGRFPVTTARFANVAFSAGSLPDGWLHRLQKRQPLAAPTDILRYFVSPRESGQICLLAAITASSGETLFPRLKPEDMRSFSDICRDLLLSMGLEPLPCSSEAEAHLLGARTAVDPDCRYFPLLLTRGDTSGEKPYEEFYLPDEPVDLGRYADLGVILPNPARPDLAEMNARIDLLRRLLARPDFTKAQVVSLLSQFVPGFNHRETGTNLDSKM